MWKTLVMRGLKGLNILITTVLFSLCWRYCYVPEFGMQQLAKHIVVVAILYMIVVIMLDRIYNALTVGSYRISQMIHSQALTALLSALIAYLAVVAISMRLVGPLPLLITVVCQVIWSVVWCIVANRLYFILNKPKKTVIVYCNDKELRKFDEIKYFEMKFQVIKYIKQPTSCQQLLNDLQGAEAVFIMDLDMDIRNAVAKYCIKNNAQCYIQPHIGDLIAAGAEHMQTFNMPIMRIQEAKPHLEYLVLKRLFDIVASLLAIIITSPIMLATALAIKLHDHGPVFYKQIRLTKNRKEFKILKFRSMRTDAEKDGVAQLSTKDDDRITPIGRIIRKIRVDELPQLFNILKGDMTIVGPRPERPEIAAQYEEEIPSFGLRLQVKAGLTGYAQIYGKYNTEPYDKLKMDLMYINHMSVIEDLRLMLATVKILFIPESTQGIEDGQTTALHQVKEKDVQNV